MLLRKLDSESEAATRRTLVCPLCGLSIDVAGNGDGTQFSYDFEAWARLCASPALGGASVCVVLGGAQMLAPPAEGDVDAVVPSRR